MKQTIWPISFSCILMAAILSGCAVKNTYPFANVRANLTATGNKNVAVLVVDRRDFIASGEKTPDFVGLQRGGYGNPFNVRTASKRPLSDAVAEAVSSSLRAKGYLTTAIPTRANEPVADVIRKVGAAAPDVGVVLEMKQWKSDTYVDVILKYDLELRVISPSGEILAEQRIQTDENLKGSAMNPSKYAKAAIPAAFKKALETLLNAEPVVLALGGTATATATPVASPSAPKPAAPVVKSAASASLLGGIDSESAWRMPIFIPDICETVKAMNSVNQTLRSAGQLKEPHPGDMKNTEHMLGRCAEGKSDDNQCQVFFFLHNENPIWSVGDHPDAVLKAKVSDTLEKCNHNEAALCKTKIWLFVTKPPKDPNKVAAAEVQAEECREFLLSINDADYLSAPPVVAPPPVPETPAPAVTTPRPSTPATAATAPRPSTPAPAVTQPAPGPKYSNMRQLKEAKRKGVISKAQYQQHWNVIRQMLQEDINRLKQDFRSRRIDKRQYELQIRETKRKYEGY